MNCHSCGTAIPGQARACPNCGRSVAQPPRGAGSANPDPESSGTRLSPSSAMVDPSFSIDVEVTQPDAEVEMAIEVPDEIEVEMEAEVLLDTEPPFRRPATRRPAPAKPGPAPAPAQAARRAAASPSASATQRTPKPGTPSPAEVRALASERPELVEPGLSVLRDDAGRAVGVGMQTEVGHIDLLATDSSGSLVVAMVMGSEDSGAGKEAVSELLQRIGWVRKHRAQPGQEVRGILMLSSVPDEIMYAASALSHIVSIKTYRLSVSFDDVEL